MLAGWLDYGHTGDIRSYGNIGQHCFLQVLQQESLQVLWSCTFKHLRLPHATSGSCLLWRDNHSVVRPMGYGIYGLERSIAGRNDKQFPGRSHSSVNVYLFRSYQPGNSMWHLYRRSGMHTPFHFGHRLCGSRTSLADFCLLEQDCQKENERNVYFSLMHDWACSLLSGLVSKLCSVWKR